MSQIHEALSPQPEKVNFRHFFSRLNVILKPLCFFLAKTLLPPQTPRLGARQSLNLTVNPQYADGEIGFEKTSVTVTEPDGVQPKEVKIIVLRDGTLYKADLLWSIAGVKASTDVSPIDGSIAFENGKCRSLVCMMKFNLDYSVVTCITLTQVNIVFRAI